MNEIITIIIVVILLCYFIYKHNIKNKQINELKNNFSNLKEKFIKTEETLRAKNETLDITYKNNTDMIKSLAMLREKNTRLESTMESTIKEAVVAARKDSVKRQRSILKGQATEHLAPFINTEYNAKDYRFFGDPIDFIIFDGMYNFKKTKTINKIIFMDIKTGTSQLTTLQRRIRDAIKNGNVEFQIYKPTFFEEKEEEIKNEIT